MDIISLITGLIVEPVTWSIAILIIVIIYIIKGHLVPRTQVDELLERDDRIEANLNSMLARADAEAEVWRDAAMDSQEIASEVRKQNRQLLERQKGFDHLISELRGMTGIGVDSDDDT